MLLVEELLWSLITTPYAVSHASQFKDPTIQFFIGKCLMSDGGVKRCNSITTIGAQLQYNWRLFFFRHCHKIHTSQNRHMFE